MPEAITPTRRFEHSSRLGQAKRLIGALGAPHCRELSAREAVVDHGKRREQALADRLESIEPAGDHLAKPWRHDDLTGGVH